MPNELLTQVDFCGLTVTRLIIGANPFGGFSHQSAARDKEMLDYYTVGKIKETWRRAEAAGLNAMVTNNTTSRVLQAVKEYLSEGGKLQWIVQVSGKKPDMFKNIDEVLELGCKALYFHGALVDEVYSNNDARQLGKLCEYVRSAGVPVGAAGHAPQAHLWMYDMDIADFHAVCFFNCGSLHAGAGHKFRMEDIRHAVECIQRIRKPCIAYKIMGAGRIDPLMAFEYAFENIKLGDVVNVGMHRKDRDDMVEANAAMARGLLEG